MNYRCFSEEQIVGGVRFVRTILIQQSSCRIEQPYFSQRIRMTESATHTTRLW